MQVLNFYSTVFADQMKRGRKTATIRLGDKRHKYRKNQVVLVTVGYQYSPREKLFHAVIDNVEVKRVKELSPRDIEHDNPEFRRTEEIVNFMEQIYGREISLEDTVTVVRFSQIVENPPDLQDRLRGVGGAQNCGGERSPSHAGAGGGGVYVFGGVRRCVGVAATVHAQVSSTSEAARASRPPWRSSDIRCPSGPPTSSTAIRPTVPSAVRRAKPDANFCSAGASATTISRAVSTARPAIA